MGETRTEIYAFGCEATECEDGDGNKRKIGEGRSEGAVE